MNKHILNLLQAYHDDELSDVRRAQVEAHLENCEACLVELAELQAFSSLLRDDPALQTKTRPAQFMAQVNLRLPQQQQQTFWQRAGRAIWYQVPVFLLLAFLVVQATAFTNIVFNGIQRFGIGGEETSTLLTENFESLGLNYAIDLPSFTMPDSYRFALNRLGVGSFMGGSMINMWILSVVLGLLYLSWLAGWWIGEEQA